MTLTPEEMYESNIVSISHLTTGIKDVVIWIGENPDGFYERVKVSNIPSAQNETDLFTITIPDYKIYGDVKLSDETLSEIIDFLKLNEQPILEYSKYDTCISEILNKMIPIK